MYSIEIPKVINNIISVFYYLGMWHRGDEATVRETRMKLFYCFYHLLFPVTLMIGSINSNNKDESIFLAEVAIATAVLSLKLFYINWRKDQILTMITRIGIYSIPNREGLTLANDKMKTFTKFVIFLLLIGIIGGYSSALTPIFRKDKMLFFNIGFPLDWRNNEIAFWLANAFILTEITLCLIAFLYSVIIWYLMLHCALRYEILGCAIKNMGVITVISTTDETANKRKPSNEERNNFFLRDLKSAIDSHQHIRDLIHQLESLVSNKFITQIITSGLCICGSIYCLAFNVGDNLVNIFFDLASLVYNISDIFMIMYFGNEIKLSSDRLSYCLFESNWIDKPQETKKCIIIFGELLQQPHELVVGKLYPLTLETFRRILNFAYNTFNILKNFK